MEPAAYGSAETEAGRDEWPYNVDAHPDPSEGENEPVEPGAGRRRSASRLPGSWAAGPTKRSPFGRRPRISVDRPHRGSQPDRDDGRFDTSFDEFAPEPKGTDFQHITFDDHRPEDEVSVDLNPLATVPKSFELDPDPFAMDAESPATDPEPLDLAPPTMDLDPLSDEDDAPSVPEPATAHSGPAWEADTTELGDPGVAEEQTDEDGSDGGYDYALWGFEDAMKDRRPTPSFSPAPAELWAPQSPSVPELADHSEPVRDYPDEEADGAAAVDDEDEGSIEADAVAEQEPYEDYAGGAPSRRRLSLRRRRAHKA